MPVDHSALGSLASSLAEITDRLGRLAAECGDDDEIGVELREVERQLEGTGRRLSAILRSARY